MQFFVPFAVDQDQSKRILLRTLDNLVSASYQPLKELIYQLSCTIDQRQLTQTVGQLSAINDEVIMFIFKNDRGYLVCIYSRGVAWGQPIIIHYCDVHSVISFDLL
jgi:hypothetical protein